jgi:hypothetical protein
MFQITDLISVAEAYCLAKAIPETTLSARMFNDAKKLAALREGAGITVARFNAALIWLARNWPADAVWPPHVARPSDAQILVAAE